jgi:hypothetical protein
MNLINSILLPMNSLIREAAGQITSQRMNAQDELLGLASTAIGVSTLPQAQI